MKDIGIFYGSSSGKTESVALRIFQELGSEKASILDIADSSPEEIGFYKTLILGVSTWGIGELQDDWSACLSILKKLDLSGNNVALFGLGDQESYPESFADALGILYESLKPTGCTFIGKWPTSGYDFLESKAKRDGMFVGLVLDEENQPELTQKRISDWLKGIQTEEVRT